MSKNIYDWKREQQEQRRLTALCKDIKRTQKMFSLCQSDWTAGEWLALLRIQVVLACNMKDLIGPARDGVNDYA